MNMIATNHYFRILIKQPVERKYEGFFGGSCLVLLGVFLAESREQGEWQPWFVSAGRRCFGDRWLVFLAVRWLSLLG